MRCKGPPPPLRATTEELRPLLAARLAPLLVDAGLLPPDLDNAPVAAEWAEETVRAFFDNDLLYAVRKLLADATGTFGLAITHSLEAGSELCLASRGQVKCEVKCDA